MRRDLSFEKKSLIFNEKTIEMYMLLTPETLAELSVR